MKRQILKVLWIAGTAMIWNWPTTSNAQTGIQSFLDSDGRIVFTNGLDPNPDLKVTAPSPKPSAPEPSPQPAPSEEGAKSIHALIQSIARSHGVDPALVSAVAKVESNYDPWARSPKGAMGLMQLIPATGWRFGVKDFFDPEQNIEGGVRYLRWLLELFDGNVDLSLAAYNAGENAVKRAGRIPAFPETRNYVRRIRAIYKKSYAPVLPIEPVLSAEQHEFAPEAVSEGAPAATGVIFRTVDERGVVRFSNIAPPN